MAEPNLNHWMPRRSGPPAPVLRADVRSARASDRKGGPVMVYVGVDLHRKVAHVVALDQRGEPVLNRRVAARPDEMLRVFGELDHQLLAITKSAVSRSRKVQSSLRS